MLRFQDLRNTLYELMLATHEDGNGSGGQDVTANQSMGVNLTSAVKKDGVNIIQLQNVKAIGKITTHVIEALRKLDAIEVEAQEVEPLLIEHQPDYKPTVEEALTALSKLLLAAGLNIQEMCGVMRHGAATAALEAYANNADRAGTALDVKGSYVLALRRAPSELEMLTMGFKKSE